MDVMRSRYLLSLVLLLATAWPAQAAVAARQVTLRTSLGDVRAGDVVPVEVRLDSGGETINAAEVTVAYPAGKLTYVRTSREQSVFTLWPEEPTHDPVASTVTLSGGRPGGMIAVGAHMATLYFRVRQSGPAVVSVQTASSAFFAHDGEGTQLPVLGQSATIGATDTVISRLVLESTSHATSETWGREGRIEVHWSVADQALYSYQLSKDITTVPDDSPDAQVGQLEYLDQADGVYYFTLKERLPGGQWSQPVQRPFWLDRTAPEPFALTRIDRKDLDGQDDRISWQAHDLTSGVVRYRLRGVGPDQENVTSPLAISKGWAGKRLTVVAMDAAGNERSASLLIGVKTGATQAALPWPWILGAVTVVAAAAAVIVMKRRRR